MGAHASGSSSAARFHSSTPAQVEMFNGRRKPLKATEKMW